MKQLFYSAISITIVAILIFSCSSNFPENKYFPVIPKGQKRVFDILMEGKLVGHDTIYGCGTVKIGNNTYNKEVNNWMVVINKPATLFTLFTGGSNDTNISSENNYYRYTQDGIKTISEDKNAQVEQYDPPYPLESGTVWHTDGKNGRLENKIIGYVTIASGGHQYENCLKIYSWNKEETLIGNSYFAPDIGLIEYYIEGNGNILKFIWHPEDTTSRELRESRYPNGQLKEQYYVKLDKTGNYVRDGQYDKWNDNGKKEATGTYKNGPLTDTATFWDSIPSAGCNGKWHFWYDDGDNFEETFKDGKEDGVMTAWYENGQKKAEGTFKDGKPEGISTLWYKNRQKECEETYKDGKREGPFTLWYKNRQKECEETFKDGKQEGITTEWYENGQKKAESTFKDGKQEGITTGWYENGQKKAEGTFKDGKLIE